MSLLWAWLDELSAPGVVTLSADESRHVVSRRLRTDDELVVFDAKGRWAPAVVASISKKSVQVDVGEIVMSPPPSSRFVLATAIPKGERLSSMLQMWTQLGLEVWQPIICQDSAIRKIDVASARLQRILVEGCKVARRPWSMQMRPPMGFQDAIDALEPGMSISYADREGTRSGVSFREGCVFIGPEAGFSESERELLDSAGASAVSFGEYNLRIETAAVAAMVSFNVSGESRDSA